MQLLVSDKGYVSAVPMKSASKFPKAPRIFSNELCVPLYLVVEPHSIQKYKEVRQFCHNIRTTLRVLKESTQWENLSELYIGLLKEAI